MVSQLQHLVLLKAHKMIRIFNLLLVVTVYSVSIAQDPCKFSQLHGDLDSPDILQIMTYNAYWLHDCKDDPDVKYDKNCRKSTYEAKLAGAAEVINRNKPDVLALQEVENRDVLVDLLTHLDRPMEILHYESKDTYTGQDVALLYNSAKLTQSSTLKNNLEFAADLKDDDGNIIVSQRTLSKGILEVELQVKSTDEKLVFLVTHLKSQLGGWGADLKRIAQANTLRTKIEEVFSRNKKIFVLGDFNDVNPSPTIEMITGQSKYVYDYNSDNTVLFYDVFVDYAKDYKRPGFTYAFKNFTKAAGKMRYMGTFENRIDYIFRSPWITRKKILGLCIDETGDLKKRKPSDHYPLVMTYSSVYPNDRNDKVDDSHERKGPKDEYGDPDRDM